MPTIEPTVSEEKLRQLLDEWHESDLLDFNKIRIASRFRWRRPILGLVPFTRGRARVGRAVLRWVP